MATGSRSLTLKLLADIDDFSKNLTKGENEVQGFGGKIGDFSKKAGLALAAVAAAAGAMAIKIGIDAVKSASDLSETVSKVGVLFGDSAEAINKFAETAGTKLGQTKQQALDAAATFATFGKSAGLSGDDLVKFSTGFTALASDLASFNNTSPEQAINAIGSALRGEAEPLRAYGVLLDDASLRQAALELGIINTTKNALTPQQKVLAAQELIYKQTSAAQGDFERTSGGLANQTRILSAQMENAKTTIGSALLPVVLELTTFFSKNVIPIVEKLANAFSSKTGGLGESFQDTVKVIQSYVTPIFEGAVSLFNNVKNAIVDNIDNFKSFYEVVQYLAPLVGTIIGNALKVIAPIANIVIDVFGKILGAIKPTLNFVIDRINDIIRGINIISPFKDIPYLPKITDSTTIPKSSLPVITFPTVTPSTPSTPSMPDFVANAGSGAGGAGGTTKTDGYKPDTQIVDAQLAGLAAQRAGERGDPVASAIASIAAAQAQRAGERGDTIIITNNVSGAIDPEGTARTIINTLNNSYYRGTGGAGALVMA